MKLLITFLMAVAVLLLIGLVLEIRQRYIDAKKETDARRKKNNNYKLDTQEWADDLGKTTK